MTQNREKMEKLFRERKPVWAAMAEHFGKAGLLDEAERKPMADLE